MNAPATIDTPAELISWVLDFGDCPTPLDEQGHAGWAEVIALQCHVIATRLMSVNRALRAERLPFCDTCGARPCRNPTFCEACRRADRKAQAAPHRIVERRLTPQTTVEAIMHCVRGRGLAALKEPGNVERLSRCDAAAKAELNRRIARIGA